VIAPASAGTASIPGSVHGTARGSGGNDVTRLLDVPFADPGYYVEGRNRYIYATGHDGTGRNAFRVARYDATTGRYAAPHASMPERPRWVGRRGSPHNRGELHMWGPHVWKRSVAGPRDYVMYFSGSRRGRSDCIGMAVAASPLGPFRARPLPLRCADHGATVIDPAYFRTRNGVHYLLFKRHRYHSRDTAIWAVRVRRDGGRYPGARQFRVVDGRGRQIEAPSVVTRHGRIYLFASRQAFDTCAYRTVVYVGSALRRPFLPLGPLDLRRRNGRRFCGPGGAEVASDGRSYRMVFHAFDQNPAHAPDPVARFAWGVPLRWTAKGRPYPAPARVAARSRFVEIPSATVRRRTKSGSSSFSP
jgi:glycosyl hydrolase family 43